MRYLEETSIKKRKNSYTIKRFGEQQNTLYDAMNNAFPNQQDHTVQITSQSKAKKSKTRLLAGWKKKEDDLDSQIITTSNQSNIEYMSMGTINDTKYENEDDDEDLEENEEENQIDYL